ncbi:MAG: nucleotide exchange factor GrpE [Dehalococcoidales bacterium]|nr:nucleotide exchange factor GrpE [Dehalococcoidales bacterium]
MLQPEFNDENISENGIIDEAINEEAVDEEVISEEAVDEVEELKKALEEEKSRSEANLAGWKRAQADFVNYKRFAEQEKSDTCKYANAELLAVILPIMDDFERALASIPDDVSNQSWMEGFNLIHRKFKDTLLKQGVTEIQALGEEFDPHFMDALGSARGERDVVIQEVEKGYKLQDKVIRPARVIVGNGEEDEEEDIKEEE